VNLRAQWTKHNRERHACHHNYFILKRPPADLRGRILVAFFDIFIKKIQWLPDAPSQISTFSRILLHKNKSDNICRLLHILPQKAFRPLAGAAPSPVYTLSA